MPSFAAKIRFGLCDALNLPTLSSLLVNKLHIASFFRCNNACVKGDALTHSLPWSQTQPRSSLGCQFVRSSLITETNPPLSLLSPNMDDSMEASAYELDASSDFELPKPVSHHSRTIMKNPAHQINSEGEGASEESGCFKTQACREANSSQADEDCTKVKEAREAGVRRGELGRRYGLDERRLSTLQHAPVCEEAEEGASPTSNGSRKASE